MTKYFCGIDGGATHSTAVLLDNRGKILAELDDEPPCNHWLDGMEVCSDRIVIMIQKLKELAGIFKDETLTGLGLCLSGCDEEKTNEKLRQIVISKIDHVDYVVLASDAVGPLATASDKGGIVLICGTGSNCLLKNPDGTQFQCGGWDYLLGDEGAAWWIAYKAVKYCIDDQDNLEAAPFDTEYVWSAIRQHFRIEDRFGLLDHCYQSFSKPFFSSLAAKLAAGANVGDKLCKYLFALAGEALAKHLLAVKSKIDPTLFMGPFGLPIVCVGSVWKSWEHLQPGFLKTLGISDGSTEEHKLTRFSLLFLKKSAALGAAFYGDCDSQIPKNFTEYVQPFFKHGVFTSESTMPSVSNTNGHAH